MPAGRKKLSSETLFDRADLSYIFNNLGVRKPREDEFLRGIDETENSYLTFFDDCAVILKLTMLTATKGAFSKSPDFGDNRALKPFLKFQSGGVLFEFYRGLRLEGIEFEDDYLTILSSYGNKPCNIGYIPIKTEGFPNGLPVVIDQFAVNIQGKKNLLVPNESVEAEYLRTQAHINMVLTYKLNDAWPDRSKPADRKKMKIFWDICKSMANTVVVDKDKLITAGWKLFDGEEPDQKTKEAKTAGKKFAKKINRAQSRKAR